MYSQTLPTCPNNAFCGYEDQSLCQSTFNQQYCKWTSAYGCQLIAVCNIYQTSTGCNADPYCAWSSKGTGSCQSSGRTLPVTASPTPWGYT